MWWCCGKHTKDALGCKYSKHQSKDDEDDDKDFDEKEDYKKDKGFKCYCCKEMGHRTDDCPKDPNLR